MNKSTVFKMVSIIILSFSCLHIHAQPKHGQKNMPQQTPKEANEFLNYRGQRKPVESEDFYIQELTAGYSQSETFVLTIYFNQVINPKSITKENITVTSSITYNISNISFNKEGSKVQITIKDNICFPITLTVSNVQSYNAKIISQTVENINNNETLKYNKEADQWKKF